MARNFKNNKLSMNKKIIEDRYGHIPEFAIFRTTKIKPNDFVKWLQHW